MSNAKLITIAIPCYKSANTIEGVVDGIVEQFKNQTEYDYEIILVNDGSPDNTFESIHRICSKDPKVTGVNLSKNFGQSAAKMAAVKYVQGDYLVFMDDDGQHPAEGIFTLVNKIEEGYDIVYAEFKNKKTTVFRKLTSDFYSKLAEINGTKVKGIAISSFQALSSFAVSALKKYDSPFPSIGGYLNKITKKVSNVEVEHLKRADGKSGYNFIKRFSLFIMSFTNFSLVPLRIADFVGMLGAIAGFILGIIIIIKRLINSSYPVGYASVLTVLLIFDGIIMLALGLLGEYIGRTYMTISGMPQFYVTEEINYKNRGEINEKLEK